MKNDEKCVEHTIYIDERYTIELHQQLEKELRAHGESSRNCVGVWSKQGNKDAWIYASSTVMASLYGISVTTVWHTKIRTKNKELVMFLLIKCKVANVKKEEYNYDNKDLYHR